MVPLGRLLLRLQIRLEVKEDEDEHDEDKEEEEKSVRLDYTIDTQTSPRWTQHGFRWASSLSAHWARAARRAR